MSMNRIQFQPGLSRLKFLKQFGAEVPPARYATDASSGSRHRTSLRRLASVS
jgi:hypothetical protein